MSRFDQYVTGGADDQPATAAAASSGGSRFDQYLDQPQKPPTPAAPPRTWGETLSGVAQTADDAVRAAANAVTFGMADRFAGYMSGTGTDKQVQLSEAARERSPVASLAGDVGGAVALPGFGGAGLAARLGGKFGGRAVGYGLEGMGVGAAQGAGNTYTGNVGDYVENAAKGAVLGGVLGAASGGVLGSRTPRSSAELPNKTEAKAFTDQAYKDLRANPTPYSASKLAERGDDLERILRNDGFLNAPGFSPGTFDALGTVQNLYKGVTHVTPADIDKIRQRLNNIPRGEEHATDRASARIVKDALDDFLANPPKGALGPGATAADAAEASRLAKLAVDSRKAQARIEMFDNAVERAAQTRAGPEGMQRHVTNRFLNPESYAAQSRLRAFPQAEREALANIPQTTRAERLLHNFGDFGLGYGSTKLGTTGLGLAGGAFYGYHQGDPITGLAAGAGIAGAGKASRSLANRIGQSRIDAAEALIKQNSPIYRSRAATAPMTSKNFPGTASAARNAVVQGLIENAFDEQRRIPRIVVTPDPQRYPQYAR